jgi:hypothetical protein
MIVAVYIEELQTEAGNQVDVKSARKMGCKTS